MLLKGTITLLCFYFIANQFQQKRLSLSDIELPDYFVPIILLQLLLMALNWWLDIWRWKISIETVERISFKQATIDVLSGLSMNWVLPFTVGDFLARIASKREKYKSTAALLLNRAIMLVLTFIVGFYGLIAFLKNESIGDFILVSGIVLIVLLVVLLKVLPKKFLAYFIELEASVLWKVIFVSIGRYAVFFFQFLLLLKLFNSQLDLGTLTAGIGWIFFVRTAIPSLLGGLGLRESSAYIFFQPLVQNISMIVFPVFILWVINTVIPSLIGVILLWKLKTNNSMDSHNIA